MKFKNIILALVLLFAVFANTTQEMQAKKIIEAQGYNQAISVDPLSFIFWKILYATYEHKLSPTNSFTADLRYWSFGDWYSLGLGGSYRWYLTDIFKDPKTPLEGLSVGPFIYFDYWSYNGPKFTDPFTGKSIYDDWGGLSVIIGGEAAYKWIFEGGWFVEANLKLGFPVSKVDNMGTLDTYGIGVNAGYAW